MMSAFKGPKETRVLLWGIAAAAFILPLAYNFSTFRYDVTRQTKYVIDEQVIKLSLTTPAAMNFDDSASVKLELKGDAQWRSLSRAGKHNLSIAADIIAPGFDVQRVSARVSPIDTEMAWQFLITARRAGRQLISYHVRVLFPDDVERRIQSASGESKQEVLAGASIWSGAYDSQAIRVVKPIWSLDNFPPILGAVSGLLALILTGVDRWPKTPANEGRRLHKTLE